MSENRSPWVLPIVLVAIAAAIYLAFVLTRSADQAEWLGTLATYGAVFVVFVAIALLAYRMLRRSRSDAALDEGRSRSGP